MCMMFVILNSHSSLRTDAFFGLVANLMKEAGESLQCPEDVIRLLISRLAQKFQQRGLMFKAFAVCIDDAICSVAVRCGAVQCEVLRCGVGCAVRRCAVWAERCVYRFVCGCVCLSVNYILIKRNVHIRNE
jgi:hypothetical protein